jgi:Tetraspanin family
LQYECCGVDANTDWLPVIGKYPDSCECAVGSEDCMPVTASQGVYSVGCYTKVVPVLRDLVDAMGGVAIFVAILEVKY